jgi:hypothetical protein
MSSTDGYVRLLKVELPTLCMQHLTSAIDLSIAIPQVLEAPADTITGYTEWVGTKGSRAISVGWDWGIVHDSIVLLNPAEIRTNILLIREDGEAESALGSRHDLAKWIDSLPWRTTAIPELIMHART